MSEETIAPDSTTNVPLHIRNDPKPPDWVTFYDAETGDEIFHSRYAPMPSTDSAEIRLDLYIDGNRVHHLFSIDRIVAEQNAVYMTLDKVYLNDNPRFPLS